MKTVTVTNCDSMMSQTSFYHHDDPCMVLENEHL